MSTESLNRTSNFEQTPHKVVDVDVLKHRLLIEKKKESFKKTLIFFSIFTVFGILALITY
tara:strand:+ start:226 stop:405 length:180 start_codon:yes stop_codon:yes gene_type:complete